MRRALRWLGLSLCALLVLGVSGTVGASYYYSSEHGQGCASCHEMASYGSAVHHSAHRNATCLDCHKATLATKLRHIRVHLSGKLPEAIRLRTVDVVVMSAQCKNCHQREYATWQAGPHSATYKQIFTNAAQNAKQHLMDDCLRCHGMHFDGSIGELVQPVDAKGPWHLVRAGFADQPTIPCLTCHELHREGSPEVKPDKRISVAGAPVHDTLAFFDRRERLHFTAASLPIPQLYDGGRALVMSQDARQAICYQCHASRVAEPGSAAAANHWGIQAGSGDDRTAMGVHEGLSCSACHIGHNQNARASCKDCHPKMSNCGLDVEKMDTTYANEASKHNVHWVKCGDCHQNGVPKKKTVRVVAGR